MVEKEDMKYLKLMPDEEHKLQSEAFSEPQDPLMELLNQPSSQASNAPTEIDEDSEGPKTSDGGDSSRSRSRGRNRWPTSDCIKHFLRCTSRKRRGVWRRLPSPL